MTPHPFLRSILLKTLSSVCLILGPPAPAAPASEFRPGEIWPDDQGVHINAHGGGILFHEGTYYWFGQHMIAGDAGNSAHVGVHVYSSKNLYQWKDEGIALRVSDDPRSDITKGCVLERPKVIYNAKTRQFVMWFHLELKGQGYSAARSGVAVADQVTGPYRFLRSLRPNAGVWPANVPNGMKQPLTREELDMLAKAGMRGDFVPEYAKESLALVGLMFLHVGLGFLEPALPVCRLQGPVQRRTFCAADFGLRRGLLAGVGLGEIVQAPVIAPRDRQGQFAAADLEVAHRVSVLAVAV